MYLYRRNVVSTTIALLVLTMSFIFVSCKEETKQSVHLKYDPELVPTMNTDSVTMLISDSGLIRYKMITKTWEVFEQAREPYWFFPDGFYMEQFDTTFAVVLTIKADTVWDFQRKKLSRLKGHVFIRNNAGETFSTDELFWDQRGQRFYSEKYVEVNRPEKGILRGIGGFQANQQMTQYDFYKSRKSEIYVREDAEDSQ